MSDTLLSTIDNRDAKGMQERFLTFLLHADYQGCLEFSNQMILTVEDLKFFNIKVIWPTLYRIGELWEAKHISIADEHMATKLVKRVSALHYARFINDKSLRGKIIVAASANEYHEVGARMVADFLGIAGWEVIYLGANTSTEILFETIRREKPFLIAMSVALEPNVRYAQKIIETIRANDEMKNIKIMVGGNVFSRSPMLWQTIGADGYATDAESATKTVQEWWHEQQKNELQ
jgi:MerR family transcriptional regulator, light-induced transcriptional regulator